MQYALFFVPLRAHACYAGQKAILVLLRAQSSVLFSTIRYWSKSRESEQHGKRNIKPLDILVLQMNHPFIMCLYPCVDMCVVKVPEKTSET